MWVHDSQDSLAKLYPMYLVIAEFIPGFCIADSTRFLSLADTFGHLLDFALLHYIHSGEVNSIVA